MPKQINNASVFQVIESWAPKSLAYEWDNVGLQIGSYNNQAHKVMVTLDVLESVVDEAIEKEVDLIIAHHPLLFRSLKQINVDTPIGRTIKKLMNHHITVYAAHTNLDIANGGVNDLLCDELNIKKQDYLVHTGTEDLYKVMVYVPLSHANEVRDAMSNAGAGHIGNYSHCTFQTEGQGTFKPLEGTNPYTGKINQLEYVEEVKIETIVEESTLKSVIHSMKNAHPYEEVAYDLYHLANEGESFGLGRIGLLKEQLTLESLCKHVKKTFALDHVRVIGNLSKSVHRVAVIGGSGEKYIHQAKQRGADVLITGDVTFHMAQEAEEIGLAVIDAGHYIEVVMKEAIKSKLENHFSDTCANFIISETNTNPFQVM